MGIDVLLEVIDFGLLVVAQVADADVPLSACLPLEGEHLSQVGSTDSSCGYDVMVVVAKREDLVVGLSVVGAEHQSQQLYVRLIAQVEALAEEWEAEGGDG